MANRSHFAFALVSLPIVAGLWSASLPGHQPVLTVDEPEVVTAQRMVQQRQRVEVPCDDPEVEAALARLGQMVAEEARRAARLEHVERTLYQALDRCPEVKLDVLAADCDAEPCIIIGEAGSQNWWNEIAYCEPLYTELGGKGLDYRSQTITCPDGSEHPIEGTSVWEQRPQETAFRSKEWVIALAVQKERFDVAAMRAVCGE